MGPAPEGAMEGVAVAVGQAGQHHAAEPVVAGLRWRPGLDRAEGAVFAP